VIIGNALPSLRPIVWSAVRPPQPVRCAGRVAPVCHWKTWSECEKRFGGRRSGRFRYVSRVIGSTSGPTLQTTASFCWVQTGRSEARLGCSPKIRPSRGGRMGRSVLCAIAIVERVAAYDA
jgi:hypothetical protein